MIIHLLDSIDNDTDKGFVFERLADIIIKYKCFTSDNINWTTNNYKHLEGNMNNATLKEIVDIRTYFDTAKVRSGNSSGSSDMFI